MKIGNAKTVVVAGVFAIAMMSFVSLAAGDFEGIWKANDTTGQPFNITLSADGTAQGSLREDMVGTWKQEGMAALITWKTGWATRIVKEDGQYKHFTYRPGQPLDGPPANSSAAEKLK